MSCSFCSARCDEAISSGAEHNPPAGTIAQHRTGFGWGCPNRHPAIASEGETRASDSGMGRQRVYVAGVEQGNSGLRYDDGDQRFLRFAWERPFLDREIPVSRNDAIRSRPGARGDARVVMVAGVGEIARAGSRIPDPD